MTFHDVADAVAAADHVAAFNEATMLAVEAGDEPRISDVTDTWALIAFGDAPVELAVHPDHRRRGLGRARLDLALQRGETHFWAHGDLPAAQALAASAGLSPARTLLILRRPGRQPEEPHPGRQPEEPPHPGRQPEARGRERSEATPPHEPGRQPEERGRERSEATTPARPAQPHGVTIRTATPADIDGIIAVNARAFASHPEQGAMDRADFDRRAASDWFDMQGLFVAERDGHVVGFHWTKVEDAIGEVYVVGVDPSEQGTGLGTALTARGIEHLESAGVAAIDLYVEGDNAPALAVYHRLGFTERARDTLYVAAD